MKQTSRILTYDEIHYWKVKKVNKRLCLLKIPAQFSNEVKIEFETKEDLLKDKFFDELRTENFIGFKEFKVKDAEKSLLIRLDWYKEIYLLLADYMLEDNKIVSLVIGYVQGSLGLRK